LTVSAAVGNEILKLDVYIRKWRDLFFNYLKKSFAKLKYIVRWKWEWTEISFYINFANL